MLIASFLFAIMGACAKILSEHMSSIEVVFFRNLFGVLIIGYSIYKTPMVHSGGKPMLLFFRGLMGFLALSAVFYNIAHIPLADAMTFSKTAPIFVAILAWLLFKEKLSTLSSIAIFVGFIGIVLIMQPSTPTLSKTDLLGIFSGLGAALAYTSIKELKNYYETRAIVMSFVLIGTIIPLILMFISPYINAPSLDFIVADFVVPDANMIFYIVALGVVATISQIFMTKAYAVGKAGVVGAISYSGIPFSVILGYTLGDNMPNLITIFGIIVIIVCGIAVSKEKGR